MTFRDDLFKESNYKFLGRERTPEEIPKRYSATDYLNDVQQNKKYQEKKKIVIQENIPVSNWFIG